MSFRCKDRPGHSHRWRLFQTTRPSSWLCRQGHREMVPVQLSSSSTWKNPQLISQLPSWQLTASAQVVLSTLCLLLLCSVRLRDRQSQATCVLTKRCITCQILSVVTWISWIKAVASDFFWHGEDEEVQDCKMLSRSSWPWQVEAQRNQFRGSTSRTTFPVHPPLSEPGRDRMTAVTTKTYPEQGHKQGSNPDPAMCVSRQLVWSVNLWNIFLSPRLISWCSWFSSSSILWTRRRMARNYSGVSK